MLLTSTLCRCYEHNMHSHQILLRNVCSAIETARGTNVDSDLRQMLFDEGHFMRSFKNCTDIYCSSALVNAVCATSCHLLGLDDTQDNDEQTKIAILDLKNRFLQEAQCLMKDAVPDKMTTIQTWALTFLIELGSGNGLMGSSHLRLACEMLVAKRDSEQAAEASEIASWGIMSLYTCVH